jgi:signal transduction histidine kinase
MIPVILLAGPLPEAQSQTKDSIRVFELIAKAEDFFSAAAYDSALHYCHIAEIYCKRHNYKKGLAFTIIERTDILMDKGDLEAAAQQAAGAHAIGVQLKDSLILAITFMQMAQVNMYGNKFDEAIPYFENSVHYFNHHPSRYAALAFNDFGYTYGIKGELDKKAGFLIRSIDIYESLGEGYDGEKAAAYNNLATVYYELKQRDKTIEYAKRSVALREKTGDIARLSLGCCNLSQFYLGVNNQEAIRYQQLCVKYAEQSGDESRILHSYITASLIASEQKDSNKAVEYELKTISLLEKSKKDPHMLARRYIAVGMAFSKKDSAQAITWFNKAQVLAGSLNDKFNLRDLYLQLALFYKHHKDYEAAYRHFNDHILYRDSIIKSNTASAIAGLEAKYESEKKDNLIVRLNTAQEIKTLQIEKQNALLSGNLLEAEKKQQEIDLLSKEKEVRELRISRQNEQLEKQLLLANYNQQQLELAAKEKQLQEKQLKSSRTVRNLLLTGLLLLSIIGFFLFNRYQLKRKIQEQEALLAIRNNIAKDLHDEIGSTLTSIRILSEVSGKSLNKDSNKASLFIQKITEQSAAAQQGISDIVWAVKPENDKMENMVIRMREYAAQTLECKNVQTAISIDEKLIHVSLDMQQRRDFFLIYKEAINNIAKYAQATEVTVIIENKDQQLHLLIRDNGAGFDTFITRSSNGMHNMEARAQALGGRLDIQSSPEEGTVVELLIPLT